MKRKLFTQKAKVEFIDGRLFARQSDGQLWCLQENPTITAGDTILIHIHDRQDQFCTFVRNAPELAN